MLGIPIVGLYGTKFNDKSKCNTRNQHCKINIPLPKRNKNTFTQFIKSPNPLQNGIPFKENLNIITQSLSTLIVTVLLISPTYVTRQIIFNICSRLWECVHMYEFARVWEGWQTYTTARKIGETQHPIPIIRTR